MADLGAWLRRHGWGSRSSAAQARVRLGASPPPAASAAATTAGHAAAAPGVAVQRARRATHRDRMNAARGALVLETPRLRLRELAVGDAAFVLKLLNDPTFLRYIGDRGVRDLDDARRYIVKGMIDSYERHGFGLWLVELREPDATPIGLCGLVSREGLTAPDIGFALLPQWWSRGLAHEAACAVMDYARRVVGLARVLAIANPDNASSVRLLRKLGFRYQRDVQIPGDPGPVALFSCDGDVAGD